ncbi:MAG: hypothetical protein AAGD92_08775 [Pseudomonadota bacterium]
MSVNRQHTSRLTQALLMALTLGVWGVLITLYLPEADARKPDAPGDAHFKKLTVERIDLVDTDGTLRLAVGNRAHPPAARYRGKVYERSIDDFVGMVFYEADGEETGGMGVAKLRDNTQRAFIFDYTHQLTDGVGMINRESEDGERWEAGFFISDRRPYQEGDITSSQGVERIWLKNEDKDASLVISDPEGRPRIRIGVDASGEPAITMLDETGETVFNAGATEE